MSTATPAVSIVKPKGEKDWEVMLNVINPASTRPRRLSVHTIATTLAKAGFEGRDPLTILKEMEESKKVVGYVCPDVQTPIFYLVDLCKLPGMIDTRNPGCWKSGREWITKYPWPETKGFKRFAGGVYEEVNGNKYAKYIPNPSNMKDAAFEPADLPYEKLVLEHLAIFKNKK